jgi:excisionase family DNA binding protein
MPTKTLLRPAQVARLLGVARQTVHDYEAAGKLTADRTPGGHRRYPLEDNPTLLAAMAQGGQVLEVVVR